MYTILSSLLRSKHSSHSVTTTDFKDSSHKNDSIFAVLEETQNAGEWRCAEYPNSVALEFSQPMITFVNIFKVSFCVSQFRDTKQLFRPI